MYLYMFGLLKILGIDPGFGSISSERINNSDRIIITSSKVRLTFRYNFYPHMRTLMQSYSHPVVI